MERNLKSWGIMLSVSCIILTMASAGTAERNKPRSERIEEGITGTETTGYFAGGAGGDYSTEFRDIARSEAKGEIGVVARDGVIMIVMSGDMAFAFSNYLSYSADWYDVAYQINEKVNGLRISEGW